jgi:hypothetical protein
MRRATIIAVAGLFLLTAVFAQDATGGKTRFGVLEFDNEDMLTFRGHRVDPEVKGGPRTYLSDPYRFGASDVVLVTKSGGTACPARYYFVTVSSSGAKATGPFGTCNEAKDIERQGDSISLTMQGFLGPYEPEDKRKKAFAETHVFVFRDGVVTDNGKPVR